MAVCSVEGCGKPANRKGWCNSHYQRNRLHGHPLAGATSPGELRRWLHAHADYQGDDCLPWPFGRNIYGYGMIRLDGIGMTASRAMCILAHGEPSSHDLQAAHSCGNGHLGCTNPRHLRWATASENCADQIEHGTDSRGSRHGQARLTESDVIEIREAYATGEFTQRDIAAECEVGQSLISQIVTRKIWAHV
jgi:hypothetical protein